ncbi:MAG: LamG domain-containing protein, partial [Bifidobacteriaceae bacterium]|nr:LamG domain-containing protein [Bifidobacteriaceae bacterium]
MAVAAVVAAGLGSAVPAVAADPPEPVVQALWEFEGDAADSSGNGHDGTVGAGVAFQDGAAVFSNSDSSEITVTHDQALAPAAGKSWTLEVDGITPGALTNNHQTIAQSRDSDSRFWILYIFPNGSIEFMVRRPQDAGSARYATGVTAVAGSTYNVAVTWESSGQLSLDVTGDATASKQYSAGSPVSGVSQPIRFGNGGNTGTQYFYRGSIDRVSITTQDDPPPVEVEVDLVASWLFDGDATDASGNGHHGTASQAVRFVDGAAVFAGNSSTAITVPHDLAFEPGGRDWVLELDGITPGALTGDYQTIVTSRGTNNRGWSFYIKSNNELSFWIMDDSPSNWLQMDTGVTVEPGKTYDVKVTWTAGVGITVEVSGAATGRSSYSGGWTLLPNVGSNPLRFGHGGDNGTEFYYRGSLGGARISAGESSQGDYASAALGKGAAGFSSTDGHVLTEGAATDVTDGIHSSPSLSFGLYGPSYTQVDLGAVHELDRVGLWRRWSDDRRHLDTVVVVAE